MLSDLQVQRYSRQIVLPEVGGVGQEILLASSVLVLGRGQLATTFANYLMGAGLGEMVLPERTDVEPDDGDTQLRFDAEAELQHTPDRQPRWRLAAALGADAAQIDHAHVSCLRWGIPLLWAAVGPALAYCELYEGYRADRPCAHCHPRRVVAGRHPFVDRSWITASAIGSWLAFETLKVLLGMRPSLEGKLLEFESATAVFTETATAKNPTCTICSQLSPNRVSG